MKRTGLAVTGAMLITLLAFSGCSKPAETSASSSVIDGELVYLESKMTVTSKTDWMTSSSTVYKYDEQGNLLMSVFYDANSNMTGWETDYTYDDNGNELVHVQYDAEGTATGFVSREYDENQNVSKYTTYSKSGEMITETSYKYELDDKGNMVRMDCYDDTGKFVQSNEYDEHGQIVKQTFYLDNDDQAFYFYENEYDAAGNNTKNSIYVQYSLTSEKMLESRNEMTYDAHGNMTNLVHYNSKGTEDFHYDIEYFEYVKPKASAS